MGSSAARVAAAVLAVLGWCWMKWGKYSERAACVKSIARLGGLLPFCLLRTEIWLFCCTQNYPLGDTSIASARGLLLLPPHCTFSLESGAPVHGQIPLWI